jgi:hypothetical protein
MFILSLLRAVLLCILVPLLAGMPLAQVNILDQATLESIHYYMAQGKETDAEGVTNLSFKFTNPVKRYFYSTEGNKWVVEFENASVVKEPSLSNLGIPFGDIKISKTKENIQVVEGVVPVFTDILRVEISMQKGFRPAISLSGTGDYVDLKATWTKIGVVDPEEKKMHSTVLTYSIVCTIAVLTIAGIAYLIKKTAHQDKVDDVYIQ